MKHEVLIGQTDYTVLVKMRDDAGAPATGLDETDIDIAYARVETDNDVTTADVTPAALANLTAAHSDWGFEVVSDTDHPGLYRLDIADAVFASGAWSAVVTVTGTGLDPADLEFVLVSHNPQSAIADILVDTSTTLDDLVDGVESTLATMDGKLDTIDNFLDLEVAAILADTNELQTDWADGGRLDLILDARASAAALDTVDNFLDTEIGAIITTLGTPAGASTSADIAAIEAQTDDIGAGGAGLTAVPWNANWDAEVQSEVNDALGEAIAELTGDAGATPTIRQALMLLYMALRNERTTTADLDTISNNAGDVILEAGLSDDATTFTKDEYANP